MQSLLVKSGDSQIDLGRKDVGYLEVSIPDTSLTWPERVVFGPFSDFMHFSAAMEPVESGEDGLRFRSRFLAGRYMQIEWHGASLLHEPPPEASSISFRSIRHDQDPVGFFRCSDPSLTRLSDVCTETIRLCMLPHHEGNSTLHLQPQASRTFAREWSGIVDDVVLVDGPRRDREVWVGDLLPQIRTCWLAFQEVNVIRNSFQVFLDHMDERGYFPASSISMQCFHEYNAWFLIVLHEYVLLSGDRIFLLEEAPKVRRLVEFLLTLLDQDGLLDLGIMQTWAWTASRSGHVTSSECVLSSAFRCAARMFEWMSDPDMALTLQVKAEDVAAQVRRHAFDDEEGAFRDTLDAGRETRYSLDANALAVLFGVADQNQAGRTLAFLRQKMWTEFGTSTFLPREVPAGSNWVHNNHIWPFAVGFEIEARFHHGDHEGAMELLRRTWIGMLDRGADTFWEIVDGRSGEFMRQRIVDAEDDRDTWNSACHGWSTAPAYLLVRYVAGIAALEPGHRRFSLSPELSGLDWIEVRVPVEDGAIDITVKGDDEGFRMTLELPDALTCLWSGRYGLRDASGIELRAGDRLTSGTYRICEEN